MRRQKVRSSIEKLAQSNLRIDNFNFGSGNIFSLGAVPPGSVTSLNIAGASGVFGGSRTIDITQATGPVVFSAVNESPNFGQYNHSNPSGTSVVTWDADGAIGGLNGADLTDSGNDDALQLDVVKIDLGSITINFTITSATGSSSLSVNDLVEGQQAFLFSSFGTISGSGADFASVDGIEMTVIAGNDIDVRLDLVQTTTRKGTFNGAPLPGTAVPMMLALGLLTRHGRRRPRLLA